MASFFIPLTGLQADSTALNTIANDLSNMNTTAFKAQTTNFSNLFYQQVGETGSGDPIAVGAGTQVSSNSTDFSQGSYNTSGMSSSDMAIDGNGFFIVKDTDGATAYTRNGGFSQNTSGNLVTDSGSQLMGYAAVNGVVNTSAPLTPINVPLMGQVQLPAATQNMSMTANLDSDSTTAFPATVSVYDSLGASHNVTVTYTETAPGTWTYSAALPAADFANGVSTPITGTMNFDPNGNLISVAQGANPAQNVGTAAGDIASIPLNFANPLTDGATNLNLNWNLLGAGGTPTISQVDEASAVSGTTADGNAAGTCTGFTIGSDGTVTATYTSGTAVVGQIALANMTNLQGLNLQADGEFQTTIASGTASVGAAGTGGLGGIQDSALEDSNVNISSEFSDLIIAQRGFEADSKAVTTFDQVAQDTINM
ncbi:MAG: flagellar hook-basal body complex protein, partial [Terracidiphilus sp.]